MVSSVALSLRGRTPERIHAFLQFEVGQMGQNVAVKWCVFLGVFLQVDGRKREELSNE